LELLSQSAGIDIPATLLRLLHVLAAVLAAGGVFFQLMALRPALAEIEDARRRELREAIAARWRVVAYGAIAALLLTGLLNYVLYKIPEYRSHPQKGLYHGLLGVKILLALAAFHGAAVLALPGAKGERYRDRAGFWLKYLAVLFTLIIAIGAALRQFPKE
jgi:uncharacterized membrane protein